MTPSIPMRHSLKTRITLATLAIFLAGIWSLAFYATRMLREDLQNVLADQQLATVSFFAAEINQNLVERQLALETVAKQVMPSVFGQPGALQAALDQRLVLTSLFNAGIFVTDALGTAIASIPVSAGRVGVNYMERDHVDAALTRGAFAISKPVVGKMLKVPVVSMAAPIRNVHGKVIGALVGVVDLSMPSFLDRIANSRYGKAGGYILADPRHKVIVTARDPSSALRPFPALGANPLFDRYIGGYEGSGTVVDTRGLEVLSSAKQIPLAGWVLIARMPAAEAFAPILAMQQRMLIAAAILTLVAAGLIWWTLKRQLAPMAQAAKTLAGLSAPGSLLQPLPTTGQDEIGHLVDGFNRVLTMLREREDGLIESELRFKVALANSPVAVFEQDLELRYVWIYNPKLGYAAQQVIGRSDADIMAAEYVAPLTALKRRVISSGQSGREEIATAAPGGPLEYYDLYVEPRRNEHGEIVGVMCAATEISERKHLEQALATRKSELETLYAALQALREDERKTVARELHDDLGHLLTALNMDAGWLDFHLTSDDPRVTRKLQSIVELVGQIADSVRRITENLRPGMLDELGLVPALEIHIANFKERTGINCELTVDSGKFEFDELTAIGVFRIVQEALNNVSKHAQADRVTINLERTSDSIRLVIEDDGTGFPETMPPGRKGFGLSGMRERVSLLNGSLSVTSRKGLGVRIDVVLPSRHEGIQA